MPTSTFFNLHDEKKQRIINAVKSEMAQARYENISINKIVIAADIARGSFYQYFKNKNDMYEFIIGEYRAEMRAYTSLLLKECGGDLFLMHKKFLAIITDKDVSVKSGAILKNIFSYIKSLDSDQIKSLLQKMNCGSVSHFSLYVDTAHVDADANPCVKDLLDLLSLVTTNSAAKIFAHTEQRAALLEAYGRKLDLIKYGSDRLDGRKSC